MAKMHIVSSSTVEALKKAKGDLTYRQFAIALGKTHSYGATLSAAVRGVEGCLSAKSERELRELLGLSNREYADLHAMPTRLLRDAIRNRVEV